MVESLKELNRICQKPDYKKVGNWMVRHVVRDAALPVTWVLLRTNITANQVTLASLVIALIGSLCLAGSSAWIFLTGTILLQIWYLLDHVDGQIARYRKTACLTGRFFDFITHHIIHGAVFFGLGLYCFRTTKSPLFVLWAFGASMSIMIFNLIHDTKYKTFFERLTQLKKIELKQKRDNEREQEAASEKDELRRFFSFIHKACEIHVAMNVITLSAILQAVSVLPEGIRFWIFLIYGTFAPILAVTKVAHVIATRSIDLEYDRTFSEE